MQCKARYLVFTIHIILSFFVAKFKNFVEFCSFEIQGTPVNYHFKDVCLCFLYLSSEFVVFQLDLVCKEALFQNEN